MFKQMTITSIVFQPWASIKAFLVFLSGGFWSWSIKAFQLVSGTLFFKALSRCSYIPSGRQGRLCDNHRCTELVVAPAYARFFHVLETKRDIFIFPIMCVDLTIVFILP
jgi:hypothetical protein